MTTTATYTKNLTVPIPNRAITVFTLSSGFQVPSAIGRSATSLTLTLQSAVLSGEQVLVSYAPIGGAGIQDDAGNQAVTFAGALATNTTVGVPAPPVLVGDPPAISVISPNDGLTVPQVNQIDIVATKPVTWTNLSVTLPNGLKTTLADATTASTSVSRAFQATAQGPYTIAGTMTATGLAPVPFSSNFTLYAPPAAAAAGTTGLTGPTGATGPAPLADAPPVSRVSEAGNSGGIVASDGQTSVQWPKSAFKEKTVVKVDPVPVTGNADQFSNASGGTSGQGQGSTAVGAVFAAGGQAVQVTATRSADGSLVRTFDDPIEIQFPNSLGAGSPVSSENGSAPWTPIPQLGPGVTTLPPGQRDGYYIDANNIVHILTRHLTYFGVLVRPAQAPLAALVAVAPKPYLAGRQTFGFLVRVTKDSTVSAVLRTGRSTLMSWPALKVKAGTYVLKRPLPRRSLDGRKAILEVRIVAGKGRVRVFRNVEFLKAPTALPARPIVLLVNGTDSRRSLQAALTKTYQIAFFTTNADSYRLLADPTRKINAVVVDLSTSPASQSQRLGLVRNLRYLFPSLRIVVATNSAKLRVQVVKAGANTTIPVPVSAKAVGSALTPLFRRP